MSATRVAPGMDDRSFAAAQDFLLGSKTFWTTRMFPALRAEYQAGKAAAPDVPDTPESVAAALHDSTLYQAFAWSERHLQRMKYSGRYGLVNWHARDRAGLEARLAAAPARLDPNLALPRYYRSIDIHQHPGGVWSDSLAGFVYERGARTTTPLAGPTHRDLHDRLVAEVERLCQPQSILDMGCGFGKSTRPFAERFPDARIEAIDLSAPCLRLAASMGVAAQQAAIGYAQADARHTGLSEASFDLVTSTMLLHELPPREVAAALAEAARLLAPGGWMVHLDFLPQVQPRADAFAQFIHCGHGRRNNEPFMEPLARMDLAALLADLGCTDIALLPFEEAPGALDPANPNWRFPWTLIRARKAPA